MSEMLAERIVERFLLRCLVLHERSVRCRHLPTRQYGEGDGLPVAARSATGVEFRVRDYPMKVVLESRCLLGKAGSIPPLRLPMPPIYASGRGVRQVCHAHLARPSAAYIVRPVRDLTYSTWPNYLERTDRFVDGLCAREKYRTSSGRCPSACCYT